MIYENNNVDVNVNVEDDQANVHVEDVQEYGNVVMFKLM